MVPGGTRCHLSFDAVFEVHLVIQFPHSVPPPRLATQQVQKRYEFPFYLV